MKTTHRHIGLMLSIALGSGVLGAAVTFPVSSHGYTLSLIQPGMMQVDGPTSAGTVILSIADVHYFERILVGSANRAGFLGKRTSDGRWFFLVEDLWRRGAIDARRTVRWPIDMSPNIPPGYDLDQVAVPEILEVDYLLFSRANFKSPGRPDITLTLPLHERITETPESTSLGLFIAGLLVAGWARRTNR